MHDLKTLRMASLSLTEALLEQFVRYERVLLAELASAEPGDWAGRFAFAHGKALTESGLDVLNLHKLKALVSDFAGKRSAWLTVQQRVASAEHHVAEARVAGRAPSPPELRVLERARTELPRLADLSEFEARYGPAALALLKSRELELTNLHQHLVKLEGSGGHLHPTSTAH